MSTVSFPLKPGMQQDAVSRLHDALITLKFTLSSAEIAAATFGPSTQDAVRRFQARYRLQVTGEVDEKTAALLNEYTHPDYAQREERYEEHPEREQRDEHPEREHERHEDEHEEREHHEEGHEESSKHERHEDEHEEHEKREKGEDEDGDDHGDGDEDDGHGKGGGPRRYLVKGTVRNANGEGVAGLTILVFEKTLRQEPLLATGQTAAGGVYSITYQPPKIEGSRLFNIVVKALNQQGNVWLESSIIFGAQPVEQVDLMDGGGVYAGPSAFEVIMVAIEPSLDGLPVAQLVETADHPDITFVAGDSGQDPEHIMDLVVSHLLSQTADLPPETFYAFLRQNLPTTVPRSLLAASAKFTKIDVLLHNVLAGIASLTPDVQKTALDQAFQKNLIPLKLKAQEDQILQHLQTLRVSSTLEQPYLTGKVSLKTMLSLSVLPDTLYTQFAELYLNSGGTSHQFWQTLGKQPGFTPDVVADVRLTLGTGSLVKNHPPAVTFLKQGFQQGQYKNLQDLAKLDINAWEDIIKQTGYPSNISGATEADKVSVFAHEIYARVESAFPTTSFVAGVTRSQTPLVQHQQHVVQFFDDNPALNLKSIHIDRYLKDNGEQALKNIPVELRQPVIQQAKAMQRVLRLASNTNAATAMLSLNIHTAQQIYFTPEAAFVSNMTAQGATKTSARRAYQRAGQTYAMTLARIADFNIQFNRVVPGIIPSAEPDPKTAQQLKDYPTLQTLFGSLDFCSCDECNSVLGAAAYLVDLLLFLKHRPSNTTNVSAKDVLLKRRPDLATLLLNCENTNTALPYIDLTCEILEETIFSTGQARQTTWTEDELRANPQYVNKHVYDINLVGAKYPNTLPFNLWLEEARVYLNHLGTPRYQLMTTFQNRVTPLPQDSDIAAEYFGISPEEASLIFVPDTANQATYWGVADPVNDLQVVATFLKQSGLSYEQLIELLDTVFVQDSADTSIIVSDSDACDTQKQHITNLSLSRLDKMHRFIRMWRRTSWKMWELDRLLIDHKMGNGTLDTNALIQFKNASDLQGRLSLSVEQLLAFYEDINIISRDVPTGHEDSLYVRLFQNSAVLNPPDAAFDLGNVNPPPTPPPPPPDVLSKHIPTLLAALAVQEADLNLLLPPQNNLTDGNLTLASLSVLYRYITLAQCMRLTISDLLLLLSTLNVADPFADLPTTISVLDAYAQLQASGFTLAQLDYLLAYRPDSPLGLRSDAIAGYLAQLRTQLLKAPDDTARQSTIKQVVSGIFHLSAEQSNTLLTTINLPGSGSTLLAILDASTLLSIAPPPPNDPTQGITEAAFPLLFATMNLLNKIALLLQKFSISSGDDLSKLLAHPAFYGGFDLSQLPVQSTQAALSFNAWLSQAQIIQFKAQYPAPEGVNFIDILAAAQTPANKTSVMDALSKLTTWDRKELDAVDSALALAAADYQQIATYRRLAACFTVMLRLGVKGAVVAAWAQQASSQDISTQIKQAAKAKYSNEQWVAIAPPLQDVIRDRKRAALVDYLVANPDPGSGKNWADANDLFGYFLIDVEMTSCQLTSRIVQATNTIQLFAQRCLMNLEPDITADTQADPDWLQWQWMKAYRLWQANREVFLYPENFILPEIRKNKTSFFKDMESDMSQNQITNDNVEAAFLTYLQKLDDVSRLEVAGMYHDDEANVLHVFARTHGIPPTYYYRTYSYPAGNITAGAWSGWEKINADIKSEHLVPVIYNRKLHLFWAVFTEKLESHDNQHLPASQANPNSPAPPNRYWEIQLAWSYYHDGKWAAHKISDLKLIHPQRVSNNVLVAPLRPQFAYTFKAMTRNDDLVINVFISPTPEFNNPIGNYNEAGQPWHSSEFVFNGTVTAINVVNINGFLQWINANYSSDGRAIGSVQQQQSSLLLPTLSRFNNEDLTNSSTNAGHLYVLKQSSLRLDDAHLLESAGIPYEVVVPHQDSQFDSSRPFFYQDKQRGYFVIPSILYQHGVSNFTPQLPASPYNAQYEVAYQFNEFYHPFTKLFIRQLDRLGVKGLFDRDVQNKPGTLLPGYSFSFASTYSPSKLVTPDSDQEIVDFSADGAYSLYNWELFFHAPLMLALRLTQNRRFEEAAQWFHYIFDPGSASSDPSPQRYWITRPFYSASKDDIKQQRIDNLLKLVNEHDPGYEAQVNQWRNDPFDPNMIATLRPVAYMKTTVMKYLDMLIAWGDSLFQQDTIETINQATQLYILAAQILGPRPQELPPLQRAADKSYKDLEADLDAFGNAMTDVENTIVLSSDGAAPNPDTPKLPQVQSFYFCIPANSQLLGYWDTVADRLFKIRHCQNIQGVTQQLPLFAPPINPALLVQAAAAGIDLGSILADITTPQSCYRFNELLKRAYSFCKEVQALGRELLTALERSDAEGLALLRSSQEINVQNKILDIRNRQVDEAAQQVDVLNQLLAEIQIRSNYYSSRLFMNDLEALGTGVAIGTIATRAIATALHSTSVVVYLIPDGQFGASGIGGTPHASAKIGGTNAGDSSKSAGKALEVLAGILESTARQLVEMGRYQVRKEEWDFRRDEANQEIKHVQSQILAAQIRQDIAQKQVDQQNIVIGNAQAIDDFLRIQKFTNQDLYNWMITQVSTVYFQAYQLAYSMAKSAEQSFIFETGQQTASYIQFGYWDSLHKGLLAGDGLLYDLQRMESDYLSMCRPLEITRTISLAQIAPDKLMQLKENGSCDFDLPEMLFDLDYPGHYMRRIRMLRLTVKAPSLDTSATSGQNVSSTLTMTKNSIRTSTSTSPQYARTGPSDTRFWDSPAPINQRIVTSNAVSDSGMFSDTEIFKLEVRDGRYLPFEGAGTISSWHLEVPQDTNSFDISSITDVTLTLLYTALFDDGLKTAAQNAVTDALPKNGMLLIDAAKLPTWAAFLTPPNPGDDQVLNLAITPQLFPFYARKRTITITQVDLLAQFTPPTPMVAELVPPMPSGTMLNLTEDGLFDSLLHVSTPLAGVTINSATQWQLRLKTSSATDFKSLPPNQLADVFILLNFQVS